MAKFSSVSLTYVCGDNNVVTGRCYYYFNRFYVYIMPTMNPSVCMYKNETIGWVCCGWLVKNETCVCGSMVYIV